MDADPAPQLIRGEPWATSHQDDAVRWLSVYDQLIALHEHMLRQADGAPAGPTDSRRAPMERGLVQLASRREYWRECCLNLAGIEYDAPRRRLLCDRGSAYFTPRESQLLEVFLRHPNQTFSSRQLLQQAWHDEDLSEEQIRTYVVRIRQKLDGLGIRGRLSSVARQGYRLHFHE